jgi:hypothetical protein
MRNVPGFLLISLLFTGSVTGQDLLSKSVQHIDASGEEFVYYSLSEGRLSTELEANFGAWDIAFQGTSIKVNGSSQILDVGFDLVEEAPEEGYATEDDGTSEIPSDAESRWFNYNFDTHVITAVADKTIVLKTKTGEYAKVKITDYYKTVFGSDPVPRSYSFRYVLGAEGSTQLN